MKYNLLKNNKPSQQLYQVKGSTNKATKCIKQGKDDSDLDELFGDSLSMFHKEVTSNEMEVYLDEPIRGLPYYRGLIHYMHCMQPEDSLIIWMDTPGGQLDSALAIIDAMETTEGAVQVIVTGEAASAGSLIALSAPNLVIGAKARFMLHSASYSVGYGKQGDIESRVENSKQLLKSVIEDGYKDFLEQSEIDLMIIGKDYYMDSAEVLRRLEARDVARAKPHMCSKFEKEVIKVPVIKKPATKTPAAKKK